MLKAFPFADNLWHVDCEVFAIWTLKMLGRKLDGFQLTEMHFI